MRRTYYIVKRMNERGEWEYQAFKRGIFSTFNLFTVWDLIVGTCGGSADHCEERLRTLLSSKKIKPVVIRVVKI